MNQNYMSEEKELKLNQDEMPVEGIEGEAEVASEEANELPTPEPEAVVEVAETAVEAVSEEAVELAPEVIEEPVAEVVADEVKVEEPVAEVVADEVEVEEPVAEVVADDVKVEEPVAEVVADEVKVEEPVAEVVKVEEPAVVVEEAVAAETPVAIAEEAIVAAPKPVAAKKTAMPRMLVPDPGFDWDSIGKKQDVYTSDLRDKLENIYDKTLTAIAEHQVIDGIIVSLGSREAVVNIGYKSDGVIPMAELRYNLNIKPGDTIEVYVENQEDLSGQLVLSHKKARILRSWDRVNAAMEKDEIINGFVKCRTKGGLIVDVFGIEAFLPGSQIDVKPIRDYDIYVGKTMEFKVVKINQEFKNVVVSHKALIQDEIEKQKADIISKLEKGQVLEGTVKNITSYGVFIDLGGVDGLIHITDLSWGRIEHPEQIVELDQKINVVILDFDDSKKRIALGLKQLQPHPWDSLDESLKIGDKVKGKVVVIADYGAFVEIAAGVEGLVHVSEMSWSQHLRTAQDFLKVGDEIEAVVLTLDRDDRKMSLGIKQLIPDPWANIVAKYPIHSRHTAIVRNFTNFGIFVELEEGVDGLIHISDLSWQKKIKHPAEFTKIGESIEVVVLEVDVENRRLSLGHKQLEENPWDVFESVFAIDSVHKGTVNSIVEKGAIITLPYGVEGFSPLRHIAKENGVMARVDETLDFKVIEFSKENRKIIVSHSRIFQDALVVTKVKEETEEQKREKATKRQVKKIKDNLEKTTLGDLGVLAGLRTEMQQEEMSTAKAKLEQMEAKRKKTTKKKADAEPEEGDEE
jgi:small subunit ribosomal protein S1